MTAARRARRREAPSPSTRPAVRDDGARPPKAIALPILRPGIERGGAADHNGAWGRGGHTKHSAAHLEPQRLTSPTKRDPRR